MGKSDLSLSTNVQYVEYFRFCMNIARVHRLPVKEMAMIEKLVTGLRHDFFHEEMHSRTFATLDDSREEFSISRKFLIELKLEHRKDFPSALSNFKKRCESTSSVGRLLVISRNLGLQPLVDDIERFQ